jgi:hypothetical protein
VSTRLLLEGPDLEELLVRIKEEHGSAATIVSAERVRSGGVAGFFSKQRFEIAVDVHDRDEASDAPSLADVRSVIQGGQASTGSNTSLPPGSRQWTGTQWVEPGGAEVTRPAENGAKSGKTRPTARRDAAAAYGEPSDNGDSTLAALLDRAEARERGLDPADLPYPAEMNGTPIGTIHGIGTIQGAANGATVPSDPDHPSHTFAEVLAQRSENQARKAALMAAALDAASIAAEPRITDHHPPVITVHPPLAVVDPPVIIDDLPDYFVEDFPDHVAEHAGEDIGAEVEHAHAEVDEKPATTVPALRDPVGALVALGVPSSVAGLAAWADAADQHDADDLYVAVAGAIARLPVPPAAPSHAGDVLVLVGPLEAALDMAPVAAALTGADPAEILVAAGSIAGTGLRRSSRLNGPADAVARWVELHTATAPRLVIVDVPVDGSGDEQAREMIRALDGTQVWACVDATRKSADLVRRLDALGRIDALAVHSLAGTADPGSVLSLGTPVALIDGRPATVRPNRRHQGGGGWSVRLTSASTLFLAAVLASPALWQALVVGDLQIQVALIRYLIAVVVAAVMIGLLSAVTRSYRELAAERQRAHEAEVAAAVRERAAQDAADLEHPDAA